jgi:L-ascorbate metabolism protein UlaG (beta-lactamase superfamily)
MRRAAKAIAISAAAAAAGVVAERNLLAAPRYHGPATDHFDGEKFHNLDQSLWQSERSFLQWQLERERGEWPEWIESEPGPPPPERVGDGGMRVTWINHATLLIQADGVNILTDPIWSLRCSPLQFVGPKRHRAPGIRFGDLPRIDLVLLSHNHYDHLDVPTLRRLQATDAPRIVTPLGNSLLLERYGIRGTMELDWWRSVRVSDAIEITCTPSQHFCARGLSDRNRALWGGFMVAMPSGNAFFAGDTGWGDHFARIAQQFPTIRVAMLPIGAYLPRWFMRPAHIDPAEAVEAHTGLRAQTSIPMHYGTFRLSDEGVAQPVDDLQRALEANGVTNFRPVEHGAGVEV